MHNLSAILSDPMEYCRGIFCAFHAELSNLLLTLDMNRIEMTLF